MTPSPPASPGATPSKPVTPPAPTPGTGGSGTGTGTGTGQGADGQEQGGRSAP